MRRVSTAVVSFAAVLGLLACSDGREPFGSGTCDTYTEGDVEINEESGPGSSARCFFDAYNDGLPVRWDYMFETPEGDPVLFSIRFDGAQIWTVLDESADRFGNGSVSAQICDRVVPGSRGIPLGADCDEASHPGLTLEE